MSLCNRSDFQHLFNGNKCFYFELIYFKFNQVVGSIQQGVNSYKSQTSVESRKTAGPWRNSMGLALSVSRES